MDPILLLEDLPPESLEGARVVARFDFNVPLRDGEIQSDARLRAALPTLEYLVEAGARVVLLSHLGRPDGPDPEASLRPVARRLGELLGREIRFSEDVGGSGAREAAGALENGQVVLLENTRFLPGETNGDSGLAHHFASLGDIFVNDAFGAAHRDHASTAGVARALRERGDRAVAGLLMHRELDFLDRVVHAPERPLVAVLGGAKISGKIDVVEALLSTVDRLLVGGAMANTFFRALGLEVGESLVEEDRVDVAGEVMEKAGPRLLLPIDCLVAERLDGNASPHGVARGAVASGERIGDIGPLTRALFREEILTGKTILWNGPVGVFESPPFREGTVEVARTVADATDRGALSIVGGGDSAAAVEAAGVAARLTHVSTGGGASLEYLAGADLPGVSALSHAPAGSAPAAD